MRSDLNNRMLKLAYWIGGHFASYISTFSMIKLNLKKKRGGGSHLVQSTNTEFRFVTQPWQRDWVELQELRNKIRTAVEIVSSHLKLCRLKSSEAKLKRQHADRERQEREGDGHRLRSKSVWHPFLSTNESQGICLLHPLMPPSSPSLRL